MKNVIKVFFALMLIFTQMSCSFASNGKKACFDEAVNEIKLLDSESYSKVLGENVKFFKHDNIVYTQHYNSLGDEMLTIISSPKNKFYATKFQIRKLDKKFLMKRNVMKNINRFNTEKGISLGMTPMMVFKILGDQYDEEVMEDGITIYRYSKKNIGKDKFGNDNKSYEYKSEYHFYKSKLIEFVFGF